MGGNPCHENRVRRLFVCTQTTPALAFRDAGFGLAPRTPAVMKNDNQPNSNLNLEEWGLPDGVLNHYKKRHISYMFPWQAECLSMGAVLDGENLIYSAPTSAGKTLVAEILVSQTVFEKQKKALFILPFVSVVREKMFYFQDMFSDSGIRVEGFMGGHTPTASFQQVQVGVCTIEKANSLINRMLEEKTLSNLGIVVVDELHLLGDPYRGYLLELLLTKLKYMSSTSDNIKLQIVGMSATLPNLNALAKWLNARLYFTDFRPVPLAEHLKCGRTIMNKELQSITEMTVEGIEPGDDSENVGQLCLETISNGHSTLIFCPTKVWCENLAVKLATYFRKVGCGKDAVIEGTCGWVLRQQLNLNKLNAVVDHLKVSPVGLDKDLAKTVPYGVAFHHAGLTLDERDIIEGSFRNGSLRVLCATSTLSSGVNLPARRVIIRSPISFGGVMDVMTYRQMIGRAGRMGVDSQGESILICKPGEKVICQKLMSLGLKPIVSCLGSGRLSASLKRAVLEVVASGIASTEDQLRLYASASFLASSASGDLHDPLTSCVEFLIESDLIRMKDGVSYLPTPLGEACLASSLPPDEGLALFRELERARRCFVLDSDLHIIYQITPYTVSEQWSKIDWLRVLSMLEELSPSMRRVADLVGIEDAFLVKVVKGTVNVSNSEHRNKLSIHRRFYTALALHDLVNEVPLPEVAIKFECNKGMLQQLQQSAATYAGMVAEFSKRLRWGTLELIVSHFQDRLQFGVQRELCELMRLPSLNGVRARALYNAGITTLAEVANSDVSAIESALLSLMPFQSKGQGAGESDYEAAQRTRLQAVWVTGRAGVTLETAAQFLVREARDLLELELGVSAKWCKNGDNKTCLETTLSKTQKSRCLKISSPATLPLETHQSTPVMDVTPIHVNELNKSHSDSQLFLVPTESTNVPIQQTVDVHEKEQTENRIHDNNQDNAVTNNSAIIEVNNVSYIGELQFETVCDWDASTKKTAMRSSPHSNTGITNRQEPIQRLFEEKKCLKVPLRTRFSTDIFEMSPKPHCSTPLQRIKPECSSPDLFSESLTFDTQLERVCDTEELPVCPEDVPSSPLKLDDLGYLSDSPVIIDEITMQQGDGPSLHTADEPLIREQKGRKRKASPDMIQGSDDSLSDSVKKSKRTRRNNLFRKRDLKRASPLELEMAANTSVVDSDVDEIAPTPPSSGHGTLREGSCHSCPSKDIEVVCIEEDSPAKEENVDCMDLNLEGINWETLNVVDVCGNQEVFQCFRDELCEQNLLALAVGCIKKQENVKRCIGAKFRKNNDGNKAASVGEDVHFFRSEDILLDGVAIYWHSNHVFYLNFHRGGAISVEDRKSVLNDLLGSSSRTIRMFDTREQLRALMIAAGVKVACSFEDPKVASWLLSTTGNEEDLSSLAKKYGGVAVDIARVLGRPHGTVSPALDVLSEVPPRTRASCEAFLTFHVVVKQLKDLTNNGLLEVFRETEMPVLNILAEMEVEGLQVDEEKIKAIKIDLDNYVASLEQQAHRLAGRRFPLSSHAAVAKVLFSELRLGKATLTAKKKTPSTSKESLELLATESKHPLPRVILQWRKLQAVINKTLCTLLMQLPQTQVRGTCQTFTVTGRISMKEPNMQNIPRDFDVELESDKSVHVCMRDMFVAPVGCTLVSADYCQIELRLLAHLSHDDALITSITSNNDIFVSVAASLFGRSEDTVTTEDRQRAKQTCYGIVYGIGARSLAQQLDVTEEAAQSLMTDFKIRYPEVRKFLEKTINDCRKQGYVKTLAGRKRYLPAINNDHPATRSEAERQAVNTRVQGSAADLVKKAMVAIQNNTGEDVKLILHLHDELMYQVRSDRLAEVAAVIKRSMETACVLSVPFPVKVKSGPTWGRLWPINC